MSTFDPFPPNDPRPDAESGPTDTDANEPSGSDFYEPRAHGLGSSHTGPVGEPDDDDHDVFEEDPGLGRGLTPGRMIAAAVATAVVLAGVLFLFTFTGATGSSGGPIASTGAGVAGSDSAGATNTSATSASASMRTSAPSTRRTSPNSGPASPRSRSKHVSTRGPSVSAPHTNPPVGPTAPPPRSSSPVTTSAPDATIAQMLIAGNAEHFFHAVSAEDQAATCGLWDPVSMAAYLSRVGIGACTQLDPATLSSPAERSADATFTVNDPTAIVIAGDTASIPPAAIRSGRALRETVQMHLDQGLWRVVFAGPSTPRTSTPVTTPPSTPPSLTSRPDSPLFPVPTTEPRP